MKIGILGAGHIGATIGRLWAQAGHEVRFGTRHPEAVAALAKELGTKASAGSVGETLVFGEAILLAVPHAAVQDLASRHAGATSGKIVIDPTNAFAASGAPAAGGSSVWTASKLPGARVVKAFNTVNFAKLASEAHQAADPVAIPIASDDAEAAGVVEGLVRDAGFAPVRVGALRDRRRIRARITVLQHWHPRFGAPAAARAPSMKCSKRSGGPR